MAYLTGHKNEGIDYVMKMPSQRKSDDLEYPGNTNMRGGARAGGKRGENDIEHHAEGDMVGEKRAMGGPMMRRPMPGAMRGPDDVAGKAMKCGGKMSGKDKD